MTFTGSVTPSRIEDRPCSGGTLRLNGPGDVDQLDPATALPHASPIMRVLSRQLLTYASRHDVREWQSVAPVPDAAVDVPSTYNAGLGASHCSYVVHLRRSMLWDTSPPRPVTAHDFVRGFKRIGNPVARPLALSFFRSTIRGMADFCDGFAAAVPAPTATAEQLAAYQNAHEISGIFALDDEALVIEVVRPSPDFVHLLALPCASAAPVEYDAFLPGSPDLTRNLRSNGPYRVAHHVPGKKLRLEPNPVWHQNADPVRRRHVDAIEVTVELAGPAQLAAALDAGRADLPWGLPVHAAPTGGLGEAAAKLGWDLESYLVFNVANGISPLRDVRVRRAVGDAIDKTAVLRHGQRAGEPDVRIAGSVVPPSNEGHQGGPIDRSHPYGDTELARTLLADAGCGEGLTLTAVYRREDRETEVVRSCAADLARAGVELRLIGLERARFDQIVRNPRDTAVAWDVMLHSQSPAWHHRNCRVFLQSMFETGSPGNLGGFSDSEIDDSIRQALEAAVEPPSRALAAWHAVERRALAQAVIVPLLFRAPAVPPRCGSRVRTALPVPALGYACDLTAVWLEELAPEDLARQQLGGDPIRAEPGPDRPALGELIRRPSRGGASWTSGT